MNIDIIKHLVLGDVFFQRRNVENRLWIALDLGCTGMYMYHFRIGSGDYRVTTGSGAIKLRLTNFLSTEYFFL